MAVSKLWTDFAVKVGASNYIDSIQSLSLNAQLSTVVEAGDGEYFASFGSLARGAPMIRFTSLDLAAALARTGVTGLALSGSTSLTAYFRRMSAGSTRDAAGAGTHISAAIANGILIPRRISARSGGNASIECEAIAIKSGGTEPVVYTAATNLPSTTAGVAALWTLGPVKLNGTALDALESVDLDFGVNPLADAKDSDIYPSIVTVQSQRPSIRVRTQHVDQIAAGLTIGADGTYFTASQVLVYFRARAEGGTFVADGTTSHVKFTLGRCRVEFQSVDGDPKQADVLITPWLDAAAPVNPLAVSTASAIT